MSDFDDRWELFTSSIIDASTGTNARKLYNVFTNQLDELKTNYDLIDDLLDIDYCTDKLLDGLASIVGTYRVTGETDDQLRDKIRTVALAKKSNGSANDIANIVKAFDSISTYTLEQNPLTDTQYWDGSVILDGYEGFFTYHNGTFWLQREVDDVDTVSYNLVDFIKNIKSAGVGGAYYLLIDITQATHYYTRPDLWDGSIILDGNTYFTDSVWNIERWDGLTTLDGTKYFFQYISSYVVDNYKIYDDNDVLIKEENHKARFLNGIYLYSALVREAECNDKRIKKIEFLNGSTVNFDVILSTPIEKKPNLRLLFFERNE